MSFLQTKFLSLIATTLPVLVVLSACSNKETIVDCYEAASFSKKSGTCTVQGTLLQTGISFAVRPVGHSPATHDLLIIVQDGDLDPSSILPQHIGEFKYCGPFEAYDGYTYLEVKFNEQGTYEGPYDIKLCE